MPSSPWRWFDSPSTTLAPPPHPPVDDTPATVQAPEPSARVKTRDEIAYDELKELFSSIDPEKTTSAAAAAKRIASEPSPDHSQSIYASAMSCSQCFDQAYYCSSAVGQLNNIYRFGTLRSCSDLWAQWRFCMRTKAMGEDMKRDRIREFNKEKSAKYKVGRSSEDVWELRSEPAENAFTK